MVHLAGILCLLQLGFQLLLALLCSSALRAQLLQLRPGLLQLCFSRLFGVPVCLSAVLRMDAPQHAAACKHTAGCSYEDDHFWRPCEGGAECIDELVLAVSQCWPGHAMQLQVMAFCKDLVTQTYISAHQLGRHAAASFWPYRCKPADPE